MADASHYQFVKLGMNLEYLRGIASVSMMQSTSLAAFPQIMDNLAEARYRVYNVVSVIRALLVQLEALELKDSRAAAAPLEPLLKEMEAALNGSPQPQSVTLRDHFADKLIAHARNIALAVKEETSK